MAIRKKLAENGVIIISINEPTGDSPTEKLVETILAGFAQLDNDIRSERTKNGLRARFKSGLLSKKAPIGYDMQAGYAVKDPKTFDKVKEAWDLMATGTKSLREIAIIMNDWGLREIIRGKEHILRPQTTNRIFRNKFYMGMITSRKYNEAVRGQHIPMITEEQFYKVQALLDGRNTNRFVIGKRNFQNIEFPLRRLIKCGKCGQGLTGGWATGKCGGRYAYYWCSKKCNYKCIKVSVLEDTVLNVLKNEVQPTNKCIDLFIAFLYKTYHERLSRLQAIQSEADQNIEHIKAQRQQLVEKNMSGVYSDEIFKEQNAILEEKLTRAMIVKDDSMLDKYNIDAVTTFIKTLLADLGETYKRSTIPQLKVMLGSVFPSGVSWNYDGTLNTTISPLYQSIRRIENNSVPFGTARETRTPTTFTVEGS